MSDRDTMPRTLICAECGGQSPRRARGWRAYLEGEGANNDPLEDFKRTIFEGAQIDTVADVRIYCPTCATRKTDDDQELEE